MSFDLPKSSYANTLGFRIALGYSVLLLVSFVLLFLFSYLFLSSNLERQDREQVRRELESLRNEYADGGRSAFDERVIHNDRVRSNNPFFTRVLPWQRQGQPEKIYFSQYWRAFNLTELTRRGFEEDHWLILPTKDDPSVYLEIYATEMPDGFRFQVGISSADRRATLARFRETTLFAIIPLMLLGLGGGTFLSWHLLRPVRHLIDTVFQVRAGKLEVRAPRSYSGDELDLLGALFNDMIERIGRLVGGLQHALDAIGHDLRTPMTRFRNRLEQALRQPTDVDGYRQAVQVALEESERMQTLLNSLLALTEAETGSLSLHYEDTDLVSLLAELVEMYGFVADENGVAIRLEAPDSFVVPVDKVRIGQALANLLDNAIKFTPAGGRVDLLLQQQGGEVHLQVMDNGRGIDSEDLPHIWNRLYRGKGSPSRGLGLGLSLVRAIVEAHGGCVWAENAPQGGATFTISLPLRLHIGEH